MIRCFSTFLLLPTVEVIAVPDMRHAFLLPPLFSSRSSIRTAPVPTVEIHRVSLRNGYFHAAFPKPLVVCHDPLSESLWTTHSPLPGHLLHFSRWYSYPEILLKVFTKTKVPGRQGACLLSRFQSTYNIQPLLHDWPFAQCQG